MSDVDVPFDKPTARSVLLDVIREIKGAKATIVELDNKVLDLFPEHKEEV